MLTKLDLQNISDLIDQKLDIKLNTVLDKKLKPIKKDVNYIKKTVDLIVKNYDEADIKIERRVKKIKEHLQI